MHYKIVYHPDVSKIDLPKIPSDIKERIRVAIEERLAKYPLETGLPLRQSLKGHRKFRTGDYRIIYKIIGEKIIILMIGHRKEVYLKISRRVK